MSNSPRAGFGSASSAKSPSPTLELPAFQAVLNRFDELEKSAAEAVIKAQDIANRLFGNEPTAGHERDSAEMQSPPYLVSTLNAQERLGLILNQLHYELGRTLKNL